MSYTTTVDPRNSVENPRRITLMEPDEPQDKKKLVGLVKEYMTNMLSGNIQGAEAKLTQMLEGLPLDKAQGLRKLHQDRVAEYQTTPGQREGAPRQNYQAVVPFSNEPLPSSKPSRITMEPELREHLTQSPVSPPVQQQPMQLSPQAAQKPTAKNPADKFKENPEQFETKNGNINWFKLLAGAGLVAAPTVIGAIAGGKKGAAKGFNMGAKGLEGVVEGVVEGRRKRLDYDLKKEELQSRQLANQKNELALEQGDDKIWYDRMMQLVDKRKDNPKALQNFANKFRARGFEDAALLLESDAVALTGKEGGRRREIQRDRLLKQADSRKDRPDVLSQIGEKLRNLGFEQDADMLVGDAEFVTQTTAETQKKDEAEKTQKGLQGQLDDLMRLKDYPNAAKLARELGQEPLAEALENTRTGPDERLVQSVAQNPILFRELPASVQAEMIVPLAEGGFDFAGVLSDPTDPNDQINQALRRTELIREMAKLKGMDLAKAEAFVDRLVPAGASPGAGQGAGGADSGGGVTSQQAIDAAVGVLQKMSPDMARQKLEASKSLTPDEKKAVAQKLGITLTPQLSPAQPESTAVNASMMGQ